MNPTPDHHAPLRDARLARALEHAPDTLEPNQPASALRDAILRAAHEAVAVPPPHPAVRSGGWAALGSVWNRWMGGRMPWNAALATVLLAGFITLLWREEPVPPAQTDLPIPSATAPAAPAEPAVPAVQENVQKEEKKAPAEPSSNPAADRAADRAAAARQRESLASRPAAPRDNAAPAPAAPSAPAAPAAAPPVNEEQARAPVAAMAPAPARQEKSLAARSAAPAAGVPQDWTALRRADGTVLPRTATGVLPRLMESLPAAAVPQADALGNTEQEMAPAPPLRAELLRDGQPLGTLTLHGQRWRFVPQPGSGLSASQGVLGEDEARALQSALERSGP